MGGSTARRLGILVLGLAVVSASCAGATSGSVPSASRPSSGPTVTPTVPSSRPVPSDLLSSEPPSPPSEPPAFHGAMGEIDADTRSTMTGRSWHEGCPVAVEDLRLLTLDHWGFDGRVHQGHLIVNATVATDVLGVFQVLFDAGFPIERMDLVDGFDGDDDRSMAANNTSAFNCRAVTGGSAWSQHSYGWAVDINPVQNPYVTSSGTVLPPDGASFLDRSEKVQGLIHAGGTVVRAFASIGWGWGGTWDDPVDYQHFSLTGR